jgi:toxin YoeB
MEISFTPIALEQVVYWKKSGNKKVMQKIDMLLKSIIETPYTGIGKPEELKHNLKGCWSRRITVEHRLVYRVVSEEEVEIISLRFHY